MIVAFGCSFTFGDELNDLPKWYEDFDDKRNFMPEKEKYHKPSKKSYPYIIGELLKCDVENYGWRGGSNDRIFRKFFEHLLHNDKSTTYIIQWTYPFRTEVWYSEGNYYSGIVPTFEDKLAKRYYKENFNEIDSRERLIRYMWSVDSVCKQFGQELIQFIPLSKDEFDYNVDTKKKIGNTYLDYPLPKIVDFKDSKLPKSLLNTDKIRRLVNCRIHPTEGGHKRLAEYLTRRIK